MKLESFKKEEERLKKEIERLEHNFKNFIFPKDSKDYRENVQKEIHSKIKQDNLEKEEKNNILSSTLESGFDSVKDFVKEVINPPEKPKNDYLIFNKEKNKAYIESKTRKTNPVLHKPVNKNIYKSVPKPISKPLKKTLHKPIHKNIQRHGNKKISKKDQSKGNKLSNFESIKNNLNNYSEKLGKVESYIDNRLEDLSKEINKLKSFGIKEKEKQEKQDKQKKQEEQEKQERTIYENIHGIQPEKRENAETGNNSFNPVIETKNSNVIYHHVSQANLVSEKEIRSCADSIRKLKTEIKKVVIGQNQVIEGLINGLICDGHVLLEGVPGIAKTLTIRALGEATGCIVKRVQFTVDLLPTDIIGITSYTPQKGFEIIKGPVFTNFLIADEINRSPPKTQSALIEAMQEKIVTIGKEDFKLPSPFFVMATKNPIENIGVYTLPEAQVDRFLFNLVMEYPDEADERKIMEQNTTTSKFEDYHLKPVIKPADIVRMQNLAKKIYLGEHIKTYIIEIVKKTRDKNFKYAEYISHGGSPRATIALFIASKSRALMEGRNYVIPEDVRAVIFDILRHRLILSYKATVKKLSVEDVIRAILDEVEVV